MAERAAFLIDLYSTRGATYRTMRALVTRLASDGSREKVLVHDWPEHEPLSGHQVLSRTSHTGITNGTERNDILGGNYAEPDEELPVSCGYQNVGQVTQIGADVTRFAVGDVIFTDRKHLEHVVSTEDANVIKLPDEVDRTHAALFGMASVAMRNCRNAQVEVGEHVLIVGAGCIGQFAAQIAALRGARVTLCDIDPARLDLARRIGAAEEIVDTGGDGWDRHIRQAFYDVVIDLAGVPRMEDQLILATKFRGRLVFVAGRKKVQYTFNLGQRRRITIRQDSHFHRADLENVCHLVDCGRLAVGPLVKDVVPVAEADRIFATLRDRPRELMGTHTFSTWSIFAPTRIGTRMTWSSFFT